MSSQSQSTIISVPDSEGGTIVVSIAGILETCHCSAKSDKKLALISYNYEKRKIIAPNTLQTPTSNIVAARIDAQNGFFRCACRWQKTGSRALATESDTFRLILFATGSLHRR